MKTAALIVCAIGLIIAALGLADAIDRHGNAQAELAQAFREGCLPKAGETAITVSDGRTARCRILSTPSLNPGMAKKLISTAAVEVTP